MADEKGPRKGGERETRSVEEGGFILPFAGEENYELGRQFMEDPKAFLRRSNLKPSDLICRTEVHDALDRGEAFGKAVLDLGGTATDPKMLEPLKELAVQYFGEDFEVAVIPFGLKFRERIRPSRGQDWTATASGTITFCDSDTDVDG